MTGTMTGLRGCWLVPEEVVLRCDAPGCDEIGSYETFTLEGRTYEVILGPNHRHMLRELAEWGRVSRSRAPRARVGRRGTDEARLLGLVVDEPSRDGNTPAQD